MPDRPHSSLSGRYRLVSIIGEGGMGRVWLARDELLGRDVAVKEITPEGFSRTELGDLRERAIREARAIAQISHPSVVRIFDVVDDGETPWIVMELIRSRSLLEVVEQDGPLTPEEAARVGLAVLAGLRAAHRGGILHRDVKPANVLMTADGRVVLTDFGLATLAGDSSMTRPGVVLGSPSYLAPERALDEPADAKGDLWSLGATLFTAIEGHAPYQKSSPMATLSALMTEPPPVSERAGVLQPALVALLRKNPDERADADEAERLLNEALTGGTPSVSPAGPVSPGPAPADSAPAGLQPSAPVGTARTDRTTAPLPSAGAGAPRRRWLIPAIAALVLTGGLALARPFTAVTSSGPPAPSAQSVPTRSAPVARSRGPAVPAATSRRPAAATPTKAHTVLPPAPSISPRATPARSAATAAAPATSKATVAPAPVVGSQIWNHGTGTCLHLPGVGREVQLWQCNGSDNQRFHFPGDGTLRVLGQCVEPRSTGRGSRVRAIACSGSARQQFTLNTARDLVHVSTDMCVDVTDWNSSNGAPAQLWTCAGTDNQKWN
ncbi:protein kinase domain-containing protein [Paractinoplanes hotanensis]|uniref:non-specific serine/threonine protein kinase n=1 Tax=Paractinoplanes hotanensis TaxID=2906497 RepID=A0ABT0YDP1_9ACTN|nr:protein kinase [Actinoplanes hotanensis]MCM4083612.1 protein kinase [Actinoplanes hotanensis]